MLDHNKAVICRIWCSGRRQEQGCLKRILQEGTALHTDVSSVVPSQVLDQTISPCVFS